MPAIDSGTATLGITVAACGDDDEPVSGLRKTNLSRKEWRACRDRPRARAVPKGLDVRQREITAIIGPSGCGKSTLLALLAGYLAPSGGRISLDGRALAQPGPDRVMVFQQPTLFPWLTAAGNVRYGLTLAANRRLAGAESFTIAPSKYLGHFVTGHLAARYGIAVRLRASLGGGTTATVELPPRLFTADGGGVALAPGAKILQ